MKTAVKRLAAGSFALGGAALAWGTLIERHLYTLRAEEVPALPRDRAPIRVLQIADPHLAPWQHRRASWISRLHRVKPDLIVITGDLLGHHDALPTVQRALAPLAGIPGVFVYGSNDYYSPVLKNPFGYLRNPSRKSTRKPDLDTAALTSMLENEFGWRNMNNSATDLQVAGTRVRAFGLGDPHIRYHRVDRMQEALESLDRTGAADVRIGVVHAPYRVALDTLLAHDASIMFAGHTHGGQVRIPGVGALTSNSDLPPQQARGLSVWFDQQGSLTQRSTFLHVSAGLGHSLYAPVRFACRPEANLVTLV